MKLGLVVGTVVATQKDEKIEGLRLMLVRDLSLKLEEKDSFVVAVDSVGAGEGEVVLYASGSSARMTTTTQNKPVDATIMAIVDTMVVGRETRYEKVPSKPDAPREQAKIGAGGLHLLPSAGTRQS